MDGNPLTKIEKFRNIGKKDNELYFGYIEFELTGDILSELSNSLLMNLSLIY